MVHTQPVPAGLFAVDWPLNLIGHIFKRGWKLRLSISPSLFPTMWQSPQIRTVTLHTGHVGQRPPSVLVLPGRQERRSPCIAAWASGRVFRARCPGPTI
jgi:hypothetical protein